MSRRYRKRQVRSRIRRAGDLLLALLVLFGLAFAIHIVQRGNQKSFKGTATANDGDTLTLAGERIRLKGIDAPELAQICIRDGAEYPCGRQARSTLRAMLEGKQLTCEGYERDRYDRLLARCRVNGKDVGAAMVGSGWAIAYGDYDDVEAVAREAGRGLWVGEFEEPSDWRKQNGLGARDAGPGWLSGLLGAMKTAIGDVLADWL